MHICFLNMPMEYYSPISGGAISTIIMQHAKRFVAQGHRVTVLTVTNEDALYPEGDIIPIYAAQREHLNLAQRALSKLRRKFVDWDYGYYEYYLNSFLKAMRGLKPAPDVVLCYNDLVSPKYIKKLLPRAKVLVNLQNEQRTTQRDLSETIASVHTFVACSKHIRNWMAEQHGIPDNKLAVINNGIDLERFYPRENYLAPTTPIKVLFVGRIDRNKGPDIAADAVAVLQKEGAAVSFSVAGGVWFYNHQDDWKDPFFCELQEKIQAVAGEYLGHVTRPNVPPLIRQHDVVCVLSRSQDPNPLVCLEGMASGCAVIGATRGGIPDAFGEAGMLVDPDDFEAVVCCLRKLVSDPETLRLEKQRSVARAQKATWENGVEKLEEVLQRAV
ncbi:MAG TPA: glycosyltransferase family 4 protein [Chthonomonadaceae bacterium]|nr:glycosyltransferase family 4 protein [Chthonomonadaceae bacterium]